MEDREDDIAELQSFLEWATELSITDAARITSQSTEPAHHISCLGHSLVVSYFAEAGGRGLAAARDIGKGELILRVPKAALVTTDSLRKADTILSLALDKYPSLSSAQALAVALLNEVSKGRSSRWYPYLKQLPRNYDTLTYFGHFEIQALQVNDAIWAAEKATQKAKTEWMQVRPLLVELKLKVHLQTFRAWLWASATISSRTMHISWDTAGCLCPVGDFFNYAAPGEEQLDSEDGCHGKSAELDSISLSEQESTTNSVGKLLETQRLVDAAYEKDFAAYCFYARKDYAKGEQVLLGYGTYTNMELLEHYGFLLEENPNDKAYIPLDLDMCSLCSWSRDSLYIDRHGKPSFAMMATLRLWATPPNKRKSIGHLAYSGRQLSVNNDVTAMRWLSDRCKQVLNNLSTSVDQDIALLEVIDNLRNREVLPAPSGELHDFLKSNKMIGMDGNISVSGKFKVLMYRWELAVRWRLKYKKILCDCIAYCSSRNRIFHVSGLAKKPK